MRTTMQEEEDTMTHTFGDNSQVKTLAFLIRNPNESHLQVDIAEEIGVSQTMVSRSATPLRDVGLIEETSNGLKLAESKVSDTLIQFVSILEFQK